MPVTNREKTSGMMVIRKRFSHSAPRYSTCSANPRSSGPPQWPIAQPTATPAASASTVMMLTHLTIQVSQPRCVPRTKRGT